MGTRSGKKFKNDAPITELDSDDEAENARYEREYVPD